MKYLNDLRTQDLIRTIKMKLGTKQDIFQYSEMPAASEDNVGVVVQYIGATRDSYTNGYFYECVENDGIYSWANKNVQAAGGSAETGTVADIAAIINGTWEDN